jgi:hypothetical protein
VGGAIRAASSRSRRDPWSSGEKLSARGWAEGGLTSRKMGGGGACPPFIRTEHDVEGRWLSGPLLLTKQPDLLRWLAGHDASTRGRSHGRLWAVPRWTAPKHTLQSCWEGIPQLSADKTTLGQAGDHGEVFGCAGDERKFGPTATTLRSRSGRDGQRGRAREAFEEEGGAMRLAG